MSNLARVEVAPEGCGKMVEEEYSEEEDGLFAEDERGRLFMRSGDGWYAVDEMPPIPSPIVEKTISSRADSIRTHIADLERLAEKVRALK